MTPSAIQTPAPTAGIPQGEQDPTSGAWLRPMVSARTPLTREAFENGASFLRLRLQDDAARISRALVEYSFTANSGVHADHLGGGFQPAPLSVRNRRRRAARLWINSILEARVDRPTLEAFTGLWLPQLCGTGPDRHLAAPHARRFIEWVRGAMTACLFDATTDNLVPEAYALHVMETVLSLHLGAARDVRLRERV